MSDSPINDELVDHLAQLARVELYPEERTKFAHDLASILDHFEELRKLDTTNVSPMNGGTLLRNVFRGDTERVNTNKGAGTEQFPERDGTSMKVPPVFDTTE